MSMAGAAGSSDKKPSAGYADKVVAKVLPNVVFTDEITGNPVAEVVVTTTADGSVLSQRLTKPSGNKAWDDAVIHLGEAAKFFPTDAALASWMAQADKGLAKIVYE